MVTKRTFIWFWNVLLVLCLFIPVQPVLARSDSRSVIVLTATGPLTPAMAEYLDRGLRRAEMDKAELLVLQLNTPGGSLDLMNRMVQSIRASAVPVVVYVTPRGAMAASAGTLITLAAHAAAMAPETIIGAASPVGGSGEDIGQTEALKIKEAMKALVRSTAERRGPDAVALGEAAIDDAKAASVSEAKQAGLIDFIAVDLPDLLRQLDGFLVTTIQGEHRLATTGLSVVKVSPSFIEQLLTILTNPNIVFLLLSVGVQALLIELSTPGGWVAGFIGVVCLALAGYGMGILTVNWFGLVFLLIAFVLFFLDIKAPTHGALTGAGVISFIVGALVLFNSPGVPSFQRVSVPLVIGTSLVLAVLFFTVVAVGLRAQRLPVRTSQDTLTNRVGVARTDIAPTGTVQVGGELWTADLVDGEVAVQQGSQVVVVSLDGMRIKVRSVVEV